MATTRLHALERKLERDPVLKEIVHGQVRMYLERGYAHKATEKELASADPKRTWYLPLNIVGHPRKPDKKRLVWDAAAKVKGVSLNTQLLKGPDLLVALPGVLSFNMRNWLSNEDTVLESLAEETGEKQRVIDFGQEEKQPRVLGLIWDPATDTFRFSINWHDELKPFINGEKRPSKRIVLRVIMSLFDPLGLLAPVLILGRIIMQDLWRSGTECDAEVGDREFVKWQQWISLLPGIHALSIPRWYMGGAGDVQCETTQLHVFTDASEQAYGCAAYFRFHTKGGIHCSLVMARSKVAPLKHQSIPRLELEAALLGARLARTVCENHDIAIKDKFIHTDSEVVLSWIRSPTRDFKQFVA
uniref:Uncharacterized protein n=1 Tax=Anopheles epiroticus TaxID=199890 RepID=A0A182PX73_9DIPT